MRNFFVGLAIISLSCPTFAQDSLSLSGKKGVFLTLQDYQFHNFGFKYWLNDQIALSSTVAFTNYTRTPVTTYYGALGHNHNASITIGLSAQAMLYSYEGASFYTSLGAEYGMDKLTSSQQIAPGTGYSSDDDVRTDTWLDVRVGIGVEYFVLSKLSISGQEFFVASHNSASDKSTFSDEQRTVDHNYYLGDASIIVTFYF